MSERVAAIDIHQKVWMVVVATAAGEVEDATGEALEFECRRLGTTHSEREQLNAWQPERSGMEVVRASTAQYSRAIGLDLERHLPQLHLAQAHSNRAPQGRKSDFQDGKPLARRLLAGELILSFVADAEPRSWRPWTRTKHQLVRLQNRPESRLEEMRIKLSSVIPDRFGVSGRCILKALSKGQTHAVKLAELGDDRLRCSREELVDA